MGKNAKIEEFHLSLWYTIIFYAFDSTYTYLTSFCPK